MTQEARNNSRLTVGVLYGFRALMVLFVCNFHIWQQGWIAQQVTIAGQFIYFDFFTRSSYIFVDGMMLLSGFLLYLPYAQAAETRLPAPDTKTFYWKRLIRIVPSYLTSVLLMLFCMALPGGEYPNAGAAVADVLAHLTFTFTFFQNTYVYTQLNVVLWTIAIEVQFYLLFPLIVRFMRQKPALTLTVMALAGLLFRLVLGLLTGNLLMLVNQLPSFLDVYALGMLGAILYIRLRKWTEHHKVKLLVRTLSVPLFALGVYATIGLVRFQSAYSEGGMDALRQSQWIVRLPLALAILVSMLSAAFWPKILQKLLDNRLMRFLAAISLNLYIWHQVIAARILRPLFPDTLHTDPSLQLIYTLLCYAVSILTAMAFTYGLEQPAARLLQKMKDKKGDNRHERPAAPKTL
jgi:peptidoglycan/LPS O-acetylase OafA/YrhL